MLLPLRKIDGVLLYSYLFHFLLLRVLLFIFSGSAAQRGLWPPRSRGSLITNTPTRHSR
jgi:hypothetical protein